jgi:hypothetical protein
MTRHGDCTVTCNLAYAGNYLERECFPQTLLFIEGAAGSLELAPDYEIRVTTASGTESRQVPPPHYAWVDSAYAVVQASIVDCHRDLLRGLMDAGYTPETTADDNLRTLRLVYDAYRSAGQPQSCNASRSSGN